MTPGDIFAATAAVYAGLPSYRDTGRVETAFVRPGQQPRTVVKPFETAFVRPDRFRFEYRDRRGEREWYRYLIWADGADVRSWWDITPGVRTWDTLEMATGAAYGVSDCSSGTVPALLLPGLLGGCWLTRLDDPAALDDGAIEGVACHRLTGRQVLPVIEPDEEELRERSIRLTGRPPERAERGPLTLWVERDTYLLRRVEQQTRFESFRTEAVTSYQPAAGTAVGDAELRFDPPA